MQVNIEYKKTSTHFLLIKWIYLKIYWEVFGGCICILKKKVLGDGIKKIWFSDLELYSCIVSILFYIQIHLIYAYILYVYV